MPSQPSASITPTYKTGLTNSAIHLIATVHMNHITISCWILMIGHDFDHPSKPVKKVGAFCWLSLAICIVELLICMKFGHGELVLFSAGNSVYDMNVVEKKKAMFYRLLA